MNSKHFLFRLTVLTLGIILASVIANSTTAESANYYPQGAVAGNSNKNANASNKNSNTSNANAKNSNANGNAAPPGPGQPPGPVPVAAAAPGLTPTPAQISVAADKGDKKQYHLDLSAGDKEITGVVLTLNDLYRSSDNREIIPKAKISFSQEPIKIPANSSVSIPINFDLSDVPNGEFTGSLLVHHSAGRANVPINVKVKHGWGWALFLLLIAIIISWWSSQYRNKGLQRDIVLVRVDRFREHIDKTKKFPPTFRSHIESILIDTDAALTGQDWLTAQQKIALAETVFFKWRKDPMEWGKQLQNINDLRDRLKELNPKSAYADTISHSLDVAEDDAPGLATPDDLHKRLTPIGDQINKYIEVKVEITRFNKLCGFQPDPPACQEKARAFQQRLDNLRPGDTNFDASLTTLKSELKTEMSGLAKPEGDAPATAAPEPDKLLPPIPGRDFGRVKGEPRARLQLFYVVSYAVALILLLLVGFGELYINKLTFGTYFDYVALIAWGFGAEATGASISNMVRGWGVSVR